MRERNYQKYLIDKLDVLFPGCIILKNDPSYRQGLPDIIILYNRLWAALEIKRSSDASIRPNQKYYVDLMDSMAFAAFIHPDNEEEVLNALQHSFSTNRPTRRSKRQ